MSSNQAVVNASDILAASENLPKYLVDKEDTLQYDLGNLTAFDYSSINKAEYKENPQEYLLKFSRDNVQLLVSRLFQCPLKVIDEGTLAILPKCITPIPRERQLPTDKPKTRWEAFAKLKGIKKKTKSQKNALEFDEQKEEYVNKYGKSRSQKEKEENWAVTAGPQDKVGEDPFTKMDEEKNDRVQRQKNREQRNYDDSAIRKSVNLGKPMVFSKDNRPQIKSDLNHQFDVAKISTASVGKFDKQLTEESAKPKRGNKRLQNLGDGNVQKESENNIKMLDRIFNKESVINVEKATSQHIKGEERKNYIKKRTSTKEGPTKKHKSSK
ncbi:ribosome biogenesis regulatory protein [Tieghemostelium lacteum]|uniref:Ribosome biogenesis regulatory protein n=1 Tax=Tieghemostelium lacteum TaxID=361077 RepID=A0A151Z7D1_TIELA|nr:ribosome biogenesis regulatory protein [Tieghemostelium lacteum]|eukprot:KYQ89694.1 ribosome biogenesis regulatory protein [Tieghemostelium lacteum]